TEEMLKEVKPFWPVNDPKIREIAQNLHSPKEVYDYVVNTFTYNYDRVGTTNQRLGALEALNAPDNALCQEFTDTFITLARAAGIPAREINGYAYTQNTTLRPLSLVPETLHAWPEYYDYESKQWIPVDPTWEHTTGGSD